MRYKKDNRNRGFTLIELLVVIGIIALLAAILFPVFIKARDKARQVTCASNMDQIGLAILQYAQDNNECFVPSGINNSTWRELTFPYAKSVGIYGCPSNTYDDAANNAIGDQGQFSISYGANGSVLPAFSTSQGITTGSNILLNEVQDPDDLFMIGESDSAYYTLHNPPNDPIVHPGCSNCLDPGGNPNSHTDLFAGHTGYGNWLFVDGHVDALRPSQTCSRVDMWDLNNSNEGFFCAAALQISLSDNDQYWNTTSAP